MPSGIQKRSQMPARGGQRCTSPSRIPFVRPLVMLKFGPVAEVKSWVATNHLWHVFWHTRGLKSRTLIVPLPWGSRLKALTTKYRRHQTWPSFAPLPHPKAPDAQKGLKLPFQWHISHISPRILVFGGGHPRVKNCLSTLCTRGCSGTLRARRAHNMHMIGRNRGILLQ